MSTDELDIVQQSIDEFISINSFFSTSTKQDKALEFLNSATVSNDLYRVLLIIDADPSVVTTKPFADITSLSAYKDEREILFMTGSIFRLVHMYRDDEKDIWIIQMQLCGDDENGLKNLFEHMKQEYGNGDEEINLRSFGDVLRKMGQFNLAEKMYWRLLNRIPSYDPLLYSLYYSLGSVTKNKGGYDSSLQWFTKSFELQIQTNPIDYVSISGIYCWNGVIYEAKNDYIIALKYYNNAVELLKQECDENHPDMAHFYYSIAISYENIDSIHERNDELRQALTYYKNTTISTSKCDKNRKSY
ncbi:hypothetical protein I4U23_013022 [Adineta vaga]|nr:hypothetical protein I4U23_013022 [Adineta vaga]